MFENCYTEELKIINGDEFEYINGFVVKENKRDFDNVTNNIENKYIFIIPATITVSLDLLIEYEEQVFEIASIILARSVDNSHAYFKISVL